MFAAERIHGDDTTVPVLAKVKTRTGRLWTYVRDDRPFGGADPPAAVYFYSPDRAGAHAEQHLAGYAGYFRPTPIADSMRFTSRGEGRARSRKPRAGRMPDASSSSLPMWLRRPATRLRS